MMFTTEKATAWVFGEQQKRWGFYHQEPQNVPNEILFYFLDIICCFDFAMSGECHYCAVAVINK